MQRHSMPRFVQVRATLPHPCQKTKDWNSTTGAIDHDLADGWETIENLADGDEPANPKYHGSAYGGVA